MFHALLLDTETFEDLATNEASALGGVARADAIFLPQFAAAPPLFVHARAIVRDLNTQHAPAGVSHKGGNMSTTKSSTTFTRSVYRDFALFALTAVGVGVAIGLTLATAVVLAAPDGGAAQPARAAAGPQHTRLAQSGADSHSLQRPLPPARLSRQRAFFFRRTE